MQDARKDELKQDETKMTLHTSLEGFCGDNIFIPAPPSVAFKKLRMNYSRN